MPRCHHCKFHVAELNERILSGRVFQVCGACRHVADLIELLPDTELSADGRATVEGALQQVVEFLLTQVPTRVAAQRAGLSVEDFLDGEPESVSSAEEAAEGDAARRSRSRSRSRNAASDLEG